MMHQPAWLYEDAEPDLVDVEGTIILGGRGVCIGDAARVRGGKFVALADVDGRLVRVELGLSFRRQLA